MELSEEIYQLILSHVDSGITLKHGQHSHTDYVLQKPAHSSVALVSKQFHRLVTPSMYGTLHITSFDKSFGSLLRTLAERPDLARMVHDVDIACWDIAVVSTASLLKIDHELIAVVDGMNFPNSISSSRFRQEVQSASEDAYVALLLLLCTELTDCKFVVPYHFDSSLVNHVQNGSLYQMTTSYRIRKPPFHRLRRWGIEHWDTENTCDIDLAPWLSLSTLESFRGFAVNLTEDSTLPVDTAVSNLKQFTIENSLMDAHGLTWILKVCPALETLQVHWGSSTVGGNYIDSTAMGIALNNHGQSLRTLELDDAEAFSTDEEDHRPLSSIANMTALTSLTVGHDFLFCDANDIPIDSDGESVASEDSRSLSLTELLPRSLHILKITACPADDDEVEELERGIRELLADETFTALHNITLGTNLPILEDALPNEWTVRKETGGWLHLERHLEVEETATD